MTARDEPTCHKDPAQFEYGPLEYGTLWSCKDSRLGDYTKGSCT